MIQVDIRPVWRFRANGERTFDFVLLTILETIDREGKLTSAATDARISYRHAWNLVTQWEEFFGAPLVTKEQGRGSSLTPLGERLLWTGRRAQARLAPELENLAAEFSRALNETLLGRESTLTMHASHDFAIAGMRGLLGAAGIDLALQYRGSFDALAALRRGECDIAGFHVPEGRLRALMERRYAECLPAREYKLISFVRRTQGLMVLPGNPKGIVAITDLCRSDVRMVNRQRGSGTRALLEFLISAEGLDRASMQGYDSEEITHGAVAALIAGHQADAGVGVQAAAEEYRLEFVPLVVERYYLACRAADAELPQIRRLAEFLRGDPLAGMVAALPGYAIDHPGEFLGAFEAVEAAPAGA